jgi:hypothetical protein
MLAMEKETQTMHVARKRLPSVREVLSQVAEASGIYRDKETIVAAWERSLGPFAAASFHNLRILLTHKHQWRRVGLDEGIKAAVEEIVAFASIEDEARRSEDREDESTEGVWDRCANQRGRLPQVREILKQVFDASDMSRSEWETISVVWEHALGPFASFRTSNLRILVQRDRRWKRIAIDEGIKAAIQTVVDIEYKQEEARREWRAHEARVVRSFVDAQTKAKGRCDACGQLIRGRDVFECGSCERVQHMCPGRKVSYSEGDPHCHGCSIIIQKSGAREGNAAKEDGRAVSCIRKATKEEAMRELCGENSALLKAFGLQ